MYVTVPLTFCAILKLFTVNINWASFLCNGMMSNDTFTASSAFYKEYTIYNIQYARYIISYNNYSCT